MIVKTLAFVAGVVALQFLPELPPGYGFATVPVALYSLRWPMARLPALALLGFFWAAFHAGMALDDILEREFEGRTVLIEGSIVDIPRRVSEQDVRFLFRSERMDDGSGWRDYQRRIRLSWYRTAQQPALGERWQFAVRMKRPHGYANPGGFDYERWLVQQRIAATGYVRNDDRNRRLDDDSPGVAAGLRRAIAARFEAMEPASPALALIRALTIGDRGAMSPGQWEVLRATGTSHLMAISGLHISLVAGLVFWLMRRVWSCLGSLPEIIPAKKAAAVLALLAAVFYAVLAGWGIPTRRAVIMLGVAMAAILSGRQVRPAHVLCLAVVAVLVIDPLAVLSAGWWLSFWAVTVIVYITFGRHGREAVWRRWTQVHVILAISLLPVLLVFFQQASVIAPVANIIAVPWVSLLVVPVSLLGILLPGAGESAGGLLLNLAAWLMDGLWPCLEWLGALDLALLHQHRPPGWTLVTATLGILLLFAPRGLPGRWAGAVLLLPMFLVKPPGPGDGEVWMTLLDVGQGLSTVIRTRNHTLVYDAGPRYSPTFDTGNSVVVPFLRAQGVTRIDKLVVSHGDNDHIGGVASLMQQLPVAEVSAGIPEALEGQEVARCLRGEKWRWDGVEFSVLHPVLQGRRKANNASCVIRVETAGGQRILLTGDIESGPELALLRELPEQLRAEVLVVPHHGSLTSSSPAFVAAVHPDYALFPVGYRNRYRFPRPEVEGRYRAAGAARLDTARHGAVTVKLTSAGRAIAAEPYRCVSMRYWRSACPDKDRFGCCPK